MNLRNLSKENLFPVIAGVMVVAIAALASIVDLVKPSFISSIKTSWLGLPLNVSLAFMLMGFALLLTVRANLGGYSSIWARLLIIFVFLASALTLFDFIHSDLALEDFLLQDNDPATLKPVRIPLLTSMSFVLLCFALLIEGAQTHYLVSQIPVSIVLLISTFELFAYIFGLGGLLNYFFKTNTHTHTALLTDLLLMLLSLGILLLDKNRGVPKIILSKYLGGSILRKITPFVLLAPIAIGILKIIGQSFGLYSLELGNLWLIVGIIMLLGIILFYQANSLNQIDETRKKNEQFLKSVLDSTNNVVFIKDLYGKYQLINYQFEKILGMHAEDLVGKKDYEIFPRAFAESLERTDDKVVNTKQMIVIEESVPLKDGEHTYLTNKFPILDDKNNVYAIGGIAIDITEQKLAEKRFRMIIEAAPDGIVIINTNGNIILVNKCTEKMFNYTAAELLNEPIWLLMPDIFNHLDLKEKEIIFKGYLKDPTQRMHELTGKRKDGSEFPIEINISPIQITEGQVALATVRNITRRKNIEARNRRNLQRLQQRHHELKLLNRFGSHMQACRKLSEAYSLISKYASLLFPNSRGTFYLVQDKNFLQAVANFNDPIMHVSILNAEDCWALRIRSLHKVTDINNQIICSHNVQLGKKCPSYICVPLFNQGVALGLFYFEMPNGEENTEDSKNQEILVSTFSDQIALGISNIKLQETLREQSIRDVLTGLYNRRYLEETFERELIRMKRNPSHLTVIIFDIDHFKYFNDTYGHEAGDDLLRALGTMILEKMRASDITCRYGGEEFVIILPDTSIGTGWQRAEHLRREVSDLRIHHENQQLKVTISLGVAAYPEQGTLMSDLLAAADTALYEAKKRGGNVTVISGS